MFTLTPFEVTRLKVLVYINHSDYAAVVNRSHVCSSFIFT